MQLWKCHDETLEKINHRNMIDYDELSSDKEVKEDESSNEKDFKSCRNKIKCLEAVFCNHFVC